MRLHILVEGVSEKAFLEIWLRRFLPSQHSAVVIHHQGKGQLSKKPQLPPEPQLRGLLDQLPAKLRAFGRSLNCDTDRVVVWVDLDEQDCRDLKKRMVALLKYCNPPPTVLFRIAIEETEAFFLGDRRAIRAAFTGSSRKLMGSFGRSGVCWKRGS